MRAEIIPYALPFVRPVRLGGRPFTNRIGWLLRVEDGRGNVGWGEAAPLPGFSRESGERALSDLKGMVGRIARGDLHPSVTDSASATFALELALANLEAAQKGVALARVLSADARPSQSLNAVLLSEEPEHEAVSAIRSGFTTLKMKVGARGVHEDADRVRRVAVATANRATLRLDANRAWSLSQAKAFGEMLEDIQIEYVEEPLKRAEELDGLASTALPVALDESMVGLRPGDLSKWAWIKAVVLKPTVIGGIRRARKLADQALALGITPVVSSAVETGVGLRGLLALAAALGTQDVPAGLDTARFLEGDVTQPQFAGAAKMQTATWESYAVDPGSEPESV